MRVRVRVRARVRVRDRARVRVRWSTFMTTMCRKMERTTRDQWRPNHAKRECSHCSISRRLGSPG